MTNVNYFIMPFLKYRPLLDNPTWREDIITGKVCEYYGVTMQELRSKHRLRELVTARHVCIYLMRRHTKLTLTQIAKLLRRDHTSVIHANRSITNLLEVDEVLKGDVNQIIAKIYN